MRPEAAREIERADLRRTDVHAFQKRRDHRMRGGLAGQKFPDVVLCKIERHIAVVGIDNGRDVALSGVVPHVADARRGAFLQISRRIDPAG